jgi:hypothetical protein
MRGQCAPPPPRVWKLDEVWKHRIASRRKPVKSARQLEAHPDVRSTPEAGQGAGPVRQRSCKDGISVC